MDKLEDWKRQLEQAKEYDLFFDRETVGEIVAENEQLKKNLNEMISIALWSTRRLSTDQLKHYALRDIKRVIGKEHEVSEFIDKWVGELNIYHYD